MLIVYSLDILRNVFLKKEVGLNCIFIFFEENRANQLWTLLSEWMTNQRSEMVVFEAARSICSLPNLTASQIKPAISGIYIMIIE